MLVRMQKEVSMVLKSRGLELECNAPKYQHLVQYGYQRSGHVSLVSMINLLMQSSRRHLA